jgi:acetolactate synthase I/II/III large subunit
MVRRDACLHRFGDRRAAAVPVVGGVLLPPVQRDPASRSKCNLVHVVWVDQGYNMVEFQEQNKYGRGSGVDFGPIDFARYAQACGAKGVAVTSPAGLGSALRQAMEVEGPVVISVPVDYSQNHLLMEPRATFGTVSTAA